MNGPSIFIGIIGILLLCLLCLTAWAEKRTAKRRKEEVEKEYEEYRKAMEKERITASENLIENTLQGILDKEQKDVDTIYARTDAQRRILERLRKEYDAMEKKPTSIWLTFPPRTFLRYAPGKGIWAVCVSGLNTPMKKAFELTLVVYNLAEMNADTIEDADDAYEDIRTRQ